MINIEYLTDQNGNQKAVVIPIELWHKIIPNQSENLDGEELSEAIENYCLNQAMNEAQSTHLLDKETALKFLEDEVES
jgi:hypothetical protein